MLIDISNVYETGVDSWTPHATLEEAQAEYNRLIEGGNQFTVSVCGVLESTDYDVSATALEGA